jgi:FAD/FMN-containing dehydrogenase
MDGEITVSEEVGLDDDALSLLRARITGGVLRDGDAGYEEARSVWNGMVDARPALIVRCLDTADVVSAVSFARAAGLGVSVRGGGHNVAGTAVREGGLVVDLSGMKGIDVDPEGRTARASGGCTLGELDAATQEFGLATPLGVVSETGIAGLTLGGGIGWLRRKHGLSSDNLVSVDLVTADGEVRTASEDENEDLFWAVRGGGGSAGIVTSFEYRLHPVGPEVMVCFVLYAGDRTAEVLRSSDEYTRRVGDDVSPVGVLGRVPAVDLFPDEAHGLPYVALLAVHPGTPDVGEAALAPLRELGDPIADLSGPMPYVDAQKLLNEDYPDGGRYYWKSVALDDLGDEALEQLEVHTAAAPSSHSTIDVWYHGGAMDRVAPDATAFGPRPAYLIGVEANWEDARTDSANIEWARGVVDDLRRFSSGGGAYLNFPGLFEEGEDLLRASYGDGNYKRLAAIRSEYDPSNLLGRPA